MLAQKLLMVLGKGGTSWLATLSTGTAVDAFKCAVAAGSGNVYIVAANANDAYVAKYNSSGSLQWQRKLSTANSDLLSGLALDSSENVYCIGSNNTSGNNDIIVAKYDTSGTIQWQRRLFSANSDTANNCCVDTSGNVFLAGVQNTFPFVAKYNTSGVLQWQRTTATATTLNNIVADSAGDLYVCGIASTNCFIAKLNSSGVIQWQRTLDSGGTERYNGIAVDSSNNVYASGYGASGTNELLLAKYNSSGTLSWQRKATVSTTGRAGDAYVAVDASGNAYLAGTGSAATDVTAIFKYNTSGTLQWQATIDPGVLCQPASIAVDGSNFYITGRANLSPTRMFTAKLPQDGTLTGTYGSFVYAASAYTTATPAYTDTAAAQVDSAGALTDTAGALTDAAGALTSTLYPKT